MSVFEAEQEYHRISKKEGKVGFNEFAHWCIASRTSKKGKGYLGNSNKEDTSFIYE